MAEPRLLNYTTEVDAAKSCAEIIGVLATHHATHIGQDYDGQGNAVAITFEVQTPSGLRAFRLPIDHESVLRVLMRQSSHGKIPRRFATMDQARRVAWRIASSWLKAQLAMLELEMVKLEQIMMPYAVVHGTMTLYEVWAARQFSLPSGGSNVMGSASESE